MKFLNKIQSSLNIDTSIKKVETMKNIITLEKINGLSNLKKTLLAVLFIALLSLLIPLFFNITFPILEIFLVNFYSIAIFHTISFAISFWVFLLMKSLKQAFYLSLFSLFFFVLILSSFDAYEIGSLNINGYQLAYISFFCVSSFISTSCVLVKGLVIFIEYITMSEYKKYH